MDCEWRCWQHIFITNSLMARSIRGNSNLFMPIHASLAPPFTITAVVLLFRLRTRALSQLAWLSPAPWDLAKLSNSSLWQFFGKIWNALCSSDRDCLFTWAHNVILFVPWNVHQWTFRSTTSCYISLSMDITGGVSAFYCWFELKLMCEPTRYLQTTSVFYVHLGSIRAYIPHTASSEWANTKTDSYYCTVYSCVCTVSDHTFNVNSCQDEIIKFKPP